MREQNQQNIKSCLHNQNESQAFLFWDKTPTLQIHILRTFLEMPRTGQNWTKSL